MKKNILDLFTKNGFVKIENAIDKNFLKEINNSILSFICRSKINLDTLNKQSEFFENFITKLIQNEKDKNSKLFNIQQSIFNFLNDEGYLLKILLQEKVNEILTLMLGSDLEYKIPNEFIINIKRNEQNNYLFKKYHQEIWSGASTNTVLLWIPLFQQTTDGQMNLIQESHLWGHIPHHNKSPIKLPKKYSVIKSNANIGDVLLFHTMTLHSSDSITHKKNKVVGRLSMAARNFKYPKNGFENLSDWKKYSYSSHSIIERILGNPSLSPFRLNDKSLKNNSWRKYFSKK